MPGEDAASELTETVPLKEVQSFIHAIRGHNVMLDSDLAALYGVMTGALNQAVKRNAARFPDDFMFALSAEEGKTLISQSVISNGRGGRQKTAYVFTEQGVAMLSSVPRSERAVQVNIAIMRALVAARGLVRSNEALAHKILNLEQKYDDQFAAVFDAIRQLIEAPPAPERRMGFRENALKEKV